MTRPPIRCDNPWCSTSTRTHRSNFAKRKCDRGGASGRPVMVLPPSLSPKPTSNADRSPARVVGDEAGGWTELSRDDDGVKQMRDAIISKTRFIWTEDVDASGSQLSTVTFAKGTDGLILSDARGNAVVFESSITNSVIDGARMSSARFGDEALVENLSAFQARLNDLNWGRKVEVRDSSFRWATLRRSSVGKGTRFYNCDFTGADLSGWEYDGSNLGDTVFDGCEFDMANFSGADMRGLHLDAMMLSQRIYFVDSRTVPPLEPGTLSPSSHGRVFMTRALTDEQFSEYTRVIGASEIDIREALERLSPAYTPVYDDGTVGARGELFRRAMSGEDIEVLSQIQRQTWEASLVKNPLLVGDPSELYD